MGPDALCAPYAHAHPALLKSGDMGVGIHDCGAFEHAVALALVSRLRMVMKKPPVPRTLFLSKEREVVHCAEILALCGSIKTLALKACRPWV